MKLTRTSNDFVLEITDQASIQFPQSWVNQLRKIHFDHFDKFSRELILPALNEWERQIWDRTIDYRDLQIAVWDVA